MPDLQTWLTYLMVVQLIPSARICELFSEAFNISISEGTIYNIRQRCYEALEQPAQAIQTALQNAAVVHYDETGFRVGSKLWWLQVGCTDALTVYFVYTKRGKAAMDAMGILAKFKGTAMHDAWSPYSLYDCLHSFCDAHHLRELLFIVERYGQGWAQKMIDLLVKMNRVVKQAKQDGLDSLASLERVKLEKKYRSILRLGFQENPVILPAENEPKRKGRPKQSKAKSLLDRLKNQQESVLEGV